MYLVTRWTAESQPHSIWVSFTFILVSFAKAVYLYKLNAYLLFSSCGLQQAENRENTLGSWCKSGG